MLKKRKFLIGGVILFAAITFLGVRGFQDAYTYSYDTVSEFMVQADTSPGQTVKVGGLVAPGLVEQDPSSNTMKFNLVDEGVILPVVYRGAVPDTFKVGNEVVVEGRIDADGVFQADTVMVKCASKYVPE